MNNIKLWPSNIKISDIDKSIWLTFIFIILIYLIVLIFNLMVPGPGWKDLQIYSWVKSHVDLGLLYTKGFNISLKEAPIYTEVYFGDDHKVYVGTPPIFAIIGTIFYKIFDGHIISARLPHVFFDLIMFYAMFVFSIKIFKSEQRYYSLLFILSPMILIYSTHQDPNTAFLGLSVLCYLCFINFIQTNNKNWLYPVCILFVIGFWTTYLFASILPGMILQLWYNHNFNYSTKKKVTLILVSLGVLSIFSVIIYLSFLPNSLEWLIYRFKERLSSDIYVSGEYKGDISIANYLLVQNLRLLTYFSPICIILCFIAFYSLIVDVRTIKNKELSIFENPNFQLQIILVLFSWGIPFNLMINGAYIHPFSLYYFSPFFAVGSAIGLKYFLSYTNRWLNRNSMGFIVVSLFLFYSISRSIFSIQGGSLEHVLYYISPSLPFAQAPINKSINANKIISNDLWKKYVGE